MKLAAMDATQKEIAAFFDVSTTTLEARLREPEYREAWERGRLMGDTSLRRDLVRLRKRSPAVCIFEAKNRLGMTDRPTATASEPLRIEFNPTQPLAYTQAESKEVLEGLMSAMGCPNCS
jgi:hypothetical protein